MAPAVPVQADGVSVARLRADGRTQLLVCVRLVKIMGCVVVAGAGAALAYA